MQEPLPELPRAKHLQLESGQLLYEVRQLSQRSAEILQHSEILARRFKHLQAQLTTLRAQVLSARQAK